MYDTIIIGAGTAGLTASIYLKRANKNVLVLEGNAYGGQIINANEIENYPGLYKISGYDYATKLYNQAKELGAIINFEKVINIKDDKIKEVTTNKNTYQAKTIIIATGAANRKLSIEKEDKFIGKGVSYCATCDGAFYKDKAVAIVGGGNTAIDESIYLSNICRKVYLIHRRGEFRAEESQVANLKKINNIEIILNSNVIELNGNDKLENIIIKNKDGKETNLEVSGLFVAIGQVPSNILFKDIVTLDDNGYIVSDDCKTNKEGIYVAGDNRTKKVRQLVTAASDGAIAAIEAINYLK